MSDSRSLVSRGYGRGSIHRHSEGENIPKVLNPTPMNDTTVRPAQVSRECLCSVSNSLVLVPLVCYGAFQGDQASRASPATACRVPCLLDSQVVRCSCINPNWAQSKGFLSKSNPLKRCSLYRGGWPWCSCYHGVKTVRCSCINLSYPESWLRSSEKGETANLRPSPQKGLRTTHRWETSVRNQVKGPGYSQKRNLGV